MSAAIEFADLSLGFKDKCLLNNFSAKIEAGEFIGVFGPNGAGKSSLLRAILGLLPVGQGKIQILGQGLKLAQAHIGYLPQVRSSLATSQLSGLSVLCALYQGHRWGLPYLTREAKAQVHAAIEMVGATSYAHRPFMLLSGGERQRLLLAQALFNSPKILLLDEPLANLDPRYQDILIEVVKMVQKRLHATVLLTAHDFNPLLPVMDRVLYLAEGQAAIGGLDEVINSTTLSRLYGANMEVVRHHQRIFVFNQSNHLLDAHEHCHSSH